MTREKRRNRFRPLLRALPVALLVLTPGLARSMEIIPSIGLTGDIRSGKEHMDGGLALRTTLFPFLKGELGARLHEESGSPGQDDTRVWPVTASLWFAPIGPLYAGGGVGWYNRTIDLGNRTDTDRDFGAHVGAGLKLPLTIGAALDLNGRYAIAGNVGDRLSHPDRLKADFWTLSAGLALGF